MTFEEELITILNQIPGAIEKAFTAFVERHPGHANQKTHGNRFGAGQAKESLRRLKEDKGEREKYKATARKQGQGNAKGANRERTLKSVEGRIRNLDYEIGVVVDKNGKILFQKKGDKNSVTFDDKELKLMKGQTVTHNHPRDTSFSVEDVMVASQLGLVEMRAVGKEHTNTLKKKGALPPLSVDIRRVHSKYNNEVFEELSWKIHREEMTVEEANQNHNHEIWTRGADELGLVYERKKI